MPLSSRVKKMQERGLSQDQIVGQLRDEGRSPDEINKALERANIKRAVDSTENSGNPEAPQQQAGGNYQEGVQGGGGFQAQSQNLTQETGEATAPQPGEGAAPAAEAPAPGEGGGEQYMPESPQAYPAEGGGYPQQYQSTQAAPQSSTITDIAEEVVDERVSEIKKSVEELERFKVSNKKRTKNIDERLKKIEETIEDLKDKIIERVAEYGESIGEVRKEMGMMQDSFSKALKPLSKKVKKKKKGSKKKKTKKKKK